MSKLTPLSEVFGDLYSPDDPQTGGELYQASDYSSLSDTAKALRAHIVDAVHGAERKKITSPIVAKRMLELGHLRGMYRKWVTYALDEHRDRLLTATASGGRRWLKCVSNKVPHPDALAREAPLPEGGRYLVLYQGSVSILGVKDRHGGSVAQDLAYLRENVPVVDVLFWDAPPSQSPTLYSLNVGAGDVAGERAEFPDLASLAVARGESDRVAETVTEGSAQ